MNPYRAFGPFIESRGHSLDLRVWRHNCVEPGIQFLNGGRALLEAESKRDRQSQRERGESDSGFHGSIVQRIDAFPVMQPAIWRVY